MNQNHSEEIIEGKEVKFNWTRVLKTVLVFLLLACVGFGVYFLINYAPAKIWYADKILGRKEHYLDCYGLPFYYEAQVAIQKHPEAVTKIQDLGGNVELNKYDCQGWDNGMIFKKADLVIVFKDKEQRKEIEKFIGQDFFGVPYRDYLSK